MDLSIKRSMFFAILGFVCKSIDFEKNSIFPWENCKNQGFEGFQVDKKLTKKQSEKREKMSGFSIEKNNKFDPRRLPKRDLKSLKIKP